MNGDWPCPGRPQGGAMAHPTHHLSDDTSDRLYTPEELASYAAADAQTHGSDPLTDPLPVVEQTVVRPRSPEPPPASPAHGRQLTSAAPADGPPSSPPPRPPAGPPS